MKILHTSDWHLGKRILDTDRLEEQRSVMDEIVRIAIQEDVDAVIVAGDLFDTANPSNEAALLLNNTLARLSDNGRRAVLALAGNHDSPDRIESPACFAQVCGVLFPGHPKTKFEPLQLDKGFAVTQTDEGFVELLLARNKTPLRIIHTPYANEYRLKQALGFKHSEKEIALRETLQTHWQHLAETYCDTKGVNILATHLLFQKDKNDLRSENPKEERPINIGGASAIYSSNVPKEIQYVALGHLHRYQTVGTEPCPIIYSGSPIAYSFAEDNQDKFVLIIEAEAGEPINIRPIKLENGKRLLRKTFTDVDDAIAWLQEHTNDIIELTLKTEEFISGTDKARLKEVHQMLEIIPFVDGKETIKESHSRIYELRNDMEGLFTEYFKKENKGQEPSGEILQLFKEILNEKS